MARGQKASELKELLERHGFVVPVEKVLSGRPPEYADPPAALDDRVRQELQRRLPNGLYRHQADAIEHALAGRDVCLATSTGSGKSLVYQVVAAHKVLRNDPTTRVLALYPARALIQDQLKKWSDLFDAIGLRVGHIDGGVPSDQRLRVLDSAQVLLATPDVVHTWLMGRLAEPSVRRFMSSVGLTVLDEAHVYEGVFGTNMAYLLRRIEVACGTHNFICATATIGEGGDFVHDLTGREAVVIGARDDTASIPPKTVLLSHGDKSDSFAMKARFLADLAQARLGRFLAFCDSRRTVERLVGTTLDILREDAEATTSSGGDGARPIPPLLPYRAGYETHDRNSIQQALADGELVGVISTSALELGVDIGEIDIVVMLGAPASAKAFRQRLGRAGRKREGYGIVLDDKAAIEPTGLALREYMERPSETNWLYLDNRYIQYAHALCAASELTALGKRSASVAPFNSLPQPFVALVNNELDPGEQIPDDLFPLKQRAQDDPHHEFLLRSAGDQSFQVEEVYSHQKLGILTQAQIMREAYPGAVYFYMGRAYRILALYERRGVAEARREKKASTSPLMQAKVFPRFNGGVRYLGSSEDGFVSEVEVQVSERVLGFSERRGSKREEHRYGVGSRYRQRELGRFFQTTGVCWWFVESERLSRDAAQLLVQTFCSMFSISERDVGLGEFFAKRSPLREETCAGWCVYDVAQGSLRLTRRLAEHLATIAMEAGDSADALGRYSLADELRELGDAASELEVNGRGLTQVREEVVDSDNQADVVAPGEEVIYDGPDGPERVRVVNWRYTPHGIMYVVEPPKGAGKALNVVRTDTRAGPIYEADSEVDRGSRLVSARATRPIFGTTRLVRVDLMTGEQV